MSPNDNTYRQPDEGTPDDAAVWGLFFAFNDWDTGEPIYQWDLGTYAYINADGSALAVVLAKENQGPPPEGWRPGTESVPSDDRNTNRSEEE